MLCQVTWVFLGCTVVHTYIFMPSRLHYSFRHAGKRYLMSILGKGVATSAFNLVNEEYIRCPRARQPKLFPWVRFIFCFERRWRAWQGQALVPRYIGDLLLYTVRGRSSVV